MRARWGPQGKATQRGGTCAAAVFWAQVSVDVALMVSNCVDQYTCMAGWIDNCAREGGGRRHKQFACRGGRSDICRCEKLLCAVGISLLRLHPRPRMAIPFPLPSFSNIKTRQHLAPIPCLPTSSPPRPHPLFTCTHAPILGHGRYPKTHFNKEVSGEEKRGTENPTWYIPTTIRKLDVVPTAGSL